MFVVVVVVYFRTVRMKVTTKRGRMKVGIKKSTQIWNIILFFAPRSSLLAIHESTCSQSLRHHDFHAWENPQFMEIPINFFDERTKITRNSKWTWWMGSGRIFRRPIVHGLILILVWQVIQWCWWRSQGKKKKDSRQNSQSTFISMPSQLVRTRASKSKANLPLDIIGPCHGHCRNQFLIYY